MIKKITLLSAFVLITFFSRAQSITFNYTGAMQTWIVPCGVTQVTVTLYGAVGGTGGETSNHTQDQGGKGGEVVGKLNVIPGSTLNIFVGGQGLPGTPNGLGVGGWNGGGDGSQGYTPPAPYPYFGGGGGGASDIRIGGIAFANRVVIAGGGGGAGFNYFACCNYDQGGLGGGLTGQSGWSGNVQGAGGSGTGGTQVSGGIGGTWAGYCTAPNGVLGIGSNDCNSYPPIGNAGAGGGGGYYGGGAGCWSGGGGGSSYVGGLAIVTSNIQGVQNTDGQVTINWTGGGSLSVNMNVTANEPCNGDCVGSGNATPVGGTPPFTYAWVPIGGTSSSVSALCAGTYSVSVTDNTGCTVVDSIVITQPTALSAPVAITNVKCNGTATGSATVTAGGGTTPYNYSWTPAGGTGSAATGLTAGSYTVTVTDAHNCVITAPAVITEPTALSESTSTIPAGCGGVNGSATINVSGGTPGYVYSWLPVGGTNATATGLSANSYTVTATDANGCQITATVNVINANSETVSIANVSAVSCFGGNNGMIQTNTAGGSTPYTYQWSPSGGTNATASNLAVGTYTITVKDANGCISTASATITQPAQLTVGIGGIVNVTCIGDSNGSAIATPGGGTPPYRYQWSPLGGSGAAGTGMKAGTDTVVVEDAQGCTVTSSVTITGNPSPVVVFSAYPLAGCGPTLCTNFKDLSTVAAGFIKSWYWTFGDDTVDTLQNPHHCYDKTGFYSVSLKVTGSNGCSATLSKLNLIDVYTSPVAAFSFGPQPTTILDPVITFTDQTKDQYGIASWFWSYGDGSDSLDTKQNPSHRYADTGRYCARLIVTNKRGCVDTTTECLVISPPFALFVPSGFSPNADGINDIFLPRGEGIAQYSLYIFNRWGNMIFHTTDINKGWDGTESSTICQQDTYIYLIDVTDIFGKAHSYLGRVTLIQ